MDAAAELGRNPVDEALLINGFRLSVENGHDYAGRDAEPVSRGQIIRHGQGQGNIDFPCSAGHEQDWQPYTVDPYIICDDHTYILVRRRSEKWVACPQPYPIICLVVCYTRKRLEEYRQSFNEQSIITTKIPYSKSKDQPGKVANPARGQLNREKEYFPVPVCA